VKAAIYAGAPLVLGGGVVKLAISHPSFWAYLIGVLAAGALIGTARGVMDRRRAKKTTMLTAADEEPSGRRGSGDTS
jgi:hypothetical protein